MTLPLALSPWVEQRFLKIDADTGLLVPNDGGFVLTQIAGTSTDLATYTNPTAPLVAHANPIELDSDGRPPSPIYILPQGYKFIVKDSDSVTLYTIPLVEDVGATALDQQGTTQTDGTTATVSPYTVVADDNMVLVDSATNPFIVQLPLAADRGTFLVVKNLSAVTVKLRPQAGEEVEQQGASVDYDLPAITGALQPTATLASDGVSNWWITAGIGL